MRFHPPHMNHFRDHEQEKPKEVKPKEFTKRIAYEFNKKREEATKSSKTYFRLLHYARSHCYLASTVFILSGISSFMSILPTQITGVAIDQIWKTGDSSITEDKVADENPHSGNKDMISRTFS